MHNYQHEYLFFTDSEWKVLYFYLLCKSKLQICIFHENIVKVYKIEHYTETAFFQHN